MKLPATLDLSALSAQVESPERKEIAPDQQAGACSFRQSRATLPEHALKQARLFGIFPEIDFRPGSHMGNDFGGGQAP